MAVDDRISQPRLLLYCDRQRRAFTLTKEGCDWREAFPSFAEAMRFAQRLRDSGMPLVVLDVWGEVIFTLEGYVYT